MFKALLLAVWYDLSDVKLAEALEDRASFRDFSADEATPERTAFMQFRRALIAHGAWTGTCSRPSRPRSRRAVTVKTGTLVDATIIASASKGDGRWVKHRSQPGVHDFQAHVGPMPSSTSLATWNAACYDWAMCTAPTAGARCSNRWWRVTGTA